MSNKEYQKKIDKHHKDEFKRHKELLNNGHFDEMFARIFGGQNARK